MKNKISRVAGLISGIAASMLPLISLAQVGRTGPSAIDPPGGSVEFETISGALCTLVAWIFTLLIILAVIFILWAAYLYLTSAGDEEKIKKANHQLLYAAIAVIVAILSRGLPVLVSTFLGRGTLPVC
ncbi:MAG: hypothetical protein Q8Q17_01805 [bacterium]|nr:hypothetical protein [bacterium]